VPPGRRRADGAPLDFPNAARRGCTRFPGALSTRPRDGRPCRCSGSLCTAGITGASTTAAITSTVLTGGPGLRAVGITGASSTGWRPFGSGRWGARLLLHLDLGLGSFCSAWRRAWRRPPSTLVEEEALDLEDHLQLLAAVHPLSGSVRCASTCGNSVPRTAACTAARRQACRPRSA